MYISIITEVLKLGQHTFFNLSIKATLANYRVVSTVYVKVGRSLFSGVILCSIDSRKEVIDFTLLRQEVLYDREGLRRN